MYIGNASVVITHKKLGKIIRILLHKGVEIEQEVVAFLHNVIGQLRNI